MHINIRYISFNFNKKVIFFCYTKIFALDLISARDLYTKQTRRMKDKKKMPNNILFKKQLIHQKPTMCQ